MAFLLDYGVPAIVFVLVLLAVSGAFALGRRSSPRGGGTVAAGRDPVPRAPPAAPSPSFQDVAWTPTADPPRPDAVWQPEPVHDWTVRQALQWWEQALRIDACENGGRFFGRLREAASSGRATVWGREGAGGLSVDDYGLKPLERIPAAHWRQYDFDAARYIYALNDEMAREASTPERDPNATRYYDLTVASTEIRALWPEAVGAA